MHFGHRNEVFAVGNVIAAPAAAGAARCVCGALSARAVSNVTHGEPISPERFQTAASVCYSPHKLAARDTSSLQMWPRHPRELMTRAPGKGLPVANVPQITARCLQHTRRSQTSPSLQRKQSAASSPAGGRSVGEEGAPLASSRG